MASQNDLKALLQELMARPDNIHCVDCGDKRPTWASLIVPPPSVAFTDPIGCFCCYHCSGAHRRMGTHICFVRSTNLDEWKPKEVEAMRKGGNALINKLFEGQLTAKQNAVVKPDKHTELDPRSAFIYDKYQHRKWFDLKAAQDKSLFRKPSPKRVSNGEFDDFFALRTKDAASDDWLPEDIEDDFLKSPLRKHNSSTSTVKGAKGGPRVDLLNRTLLRIDSKREMMDTIRGFEKDTEDQNISPRKISQSFRRKKDGSALSERGSTPASTDRPRIRRNASDDSEKRRVAPSRTKSVSSTDSDTKDRRRGVRRTDSHSDDSNEFHESCPRKLSPKRDVKRTNARSPGAGTRTEHNGVAAGLSSTSKTPRSRAVERTKSMDNDLDGELSRASSQRRSKSRKRGVRRVHSSYEAEISKDGDKSLPGLSFDGNTSARLTTRRPPRIAKEERGDGDQDEEKSKSTSRRPRSLKDSQKITSTRSTSRPRKPTSSSAK